MHEAYVYDDDGDTVDVISFCSDACNRELMGEAYQGWSGCHETDEPTFCANCGVDVSETLVNRFLSDEGVKRADGSWEQVPSSFIAFLQP